MAILVLIILTILLTFVPQWWVKKIFAENSRDHENIPGTGGQLATYLIQQLNVPDAVVLAENQPSHFNPENKTIVLSPEIYDGKSLTAVAVAAHEIGHLIQREQNDPWLRTRTSLTRWSQKVDRYGVIALMLIPLVSIITRSPVAGILIFGVGFSGMVFNVLVQLLTLPMEFDASFNKALPLLIEGGFVEKSDAPKIRRVLKAAALTYLASALSGLINLGRWIRVLRR